MTQARLGAQATNQEQRVWLVIWPGNGKPTIDVRFSKPNVEGALAVIRCAGQVADGTVVSLDVEGPDGPNGWTPVLAGEADGTRTLLKVSDWAGGQGTKPALGYIGTTGMVTNKVAAFNFNAVKRVRAFSGVTNAQGIASISFTLDPPMNTVPAVVVLPAQPALVVGGTKSELVGTPTKDGCQVKVTGSALLSSLVTALVGATANVIIIET